MKIFGNNFEETTTKTFEERLVLSIQVIFLIFFVPLILLGYYRYRETNSLLTIYVYLFLYFLLIISTFYKIKFKLKAYFLTLVLFSSSLVIFYNNGYVSTAQILFAMSSFIGVVTISLRWGILLHILSVLYQVVLSIMAINGIFMFSNPLYNEMLSGIIVANLVVGYAIYVGIIIYFIGVKYQRTRNLVDNELKQAENETQKQLSILNTLIDSIPGLFFVYTLDDKKLVRWNSSNEVVTGYNNDELLDMNITDWFDADELDKVTNEISKLENSDETFSLETVVKMNNNKYQPFLFTGRKFVMDEIDYFLGIGIDIREKKLIEDELRQSQKMEMVGTLAGGLAHDFNNVIGGVTGAISLIDYAINNIENDELLKYTGIMKSSCSKATDMVKQLLTISRKQDTKLCPIDLNQTVENIVNICKTSFDKSIVVETNCCYGKSVVQGDPNQIEQILLNFCINASHAMTIMREKDEIWGGKLSITINNVAADGNFCRNHPEANEGSYWMISISDSGVGMDKDTLRDIFNPFFTTKDIGKGTGLGLSMVYNVAKQHNGFIEVDSEIGVGSTFHLYLPKYNDEYNTDSVDIIDEIIPHGDGLVLVIDDENSIRTLAKKILGRCGYDVITAENGRVGVEMFKQRYPEIGIVLLDMAMPEMSGKETYILLKKIDPNVKVLLSSGFKQDERVNDAIELGVDGFLQKPYSFESLAQAVSRVLKEKSSL